MGQTRAQKLYKTAVDSWPGANQEEKSLLGALALMLDEATRPKKRQASGTYQDRQLGESVWKKLTEEAPSAILYSPKQVHTFSSLGRKLREAKVTPNDLDLLVNWLNSGGLSWMTSTCNWGTFIKYSLDWIGRAREAAPKAIAKGYLGKLRDEGRL
jgi:hypothetical protein